MRIWKFWLVNKSFAVSELMNSFHFYFYCVFFNSISIDCNCKWLIVLTQFRWISTKSAPKPNHGVQKKWIYVVDLIFVFGGRNRSTTRWLGLCALCDSKSEAMPVCSQAHGTHTPFDANSLKYFAQNGKKWTTIGLNVNSFLFPVVGVSRAGTKSIGVWAILRELFAIGNTMNIQFIQYSCTLHKPRNTRSQHHRNMFILIE